MDTKTIARQIRELRAGLRLTQEQFATRLGVTFSTVNRWEKGRASPSPLAMRRIEELGKTFEKGGGNLGAGRRPVVRNRG